MQTSVPTVRAPFRSHIVLLVEIVSAAILVTPAAAGAQTSDATLPSPLTGISQAGVRQGLPSFAKDVEGKTVWVTTKDGQRRKIRVTGVTTAGLTWEGPSAKPLALGQIVKIERVSHRVRNGVLIGLVIGGGLQLLVTAASAYPDESCLMPTYMCAGGIFAIGVGAGTAVGFGLNAARRGSDVIYDASRSSTTVRLQPIVSPTRNGVAVAITWR